MEVSGVIIVLLIVSALAAIFDAYTIAHAERKGRPVGTLRIDTSDLESPPRLFLELEREVDDISDMKTITLKISNESYIPHE